MYNYNYFMSLYNNTPNSNTKYEEKKYIKKSQIYVNSIDRNWNNDTDNTFFYNVTFSTNSFSIPKIFKNIKSVSIDSVIMPNLYSNIKDLHGNTSENLIKFLGENAEDSIKMINLEKLSDLPYIIMKIQELQSPNFATNNILNGASAILIKEDDKCVTNDNTGSITYSSDTKIYGNSNKSLIPGNKTYVTIFKNIGSKIVYNTPMDSLANLNISFYKNNNKKLELLNDYLSIKKIEKASNKLLINTKTYFSSEEYKTGDTILFKDVITKDYNFKKFLEREEGHTILDKNKIIVDTETATAGANNTITLIATDSQEDDYYNDMYIEIINDTTKGRVAGQRRKIIKYVSRVATVSPPWTINPDATSIYNIYDKHDNTINGLYNHLTIPLDYNRDLTNGIIISSLNLDSNTITLTGDLVNLNNQHIIQMTIETEEYL